MADFKGKRLKTHYVEEGSGEPVVFLHGLVMDHTMYAAQFEDLPDDYRCIALDLRGHGRSDCPPGPWTMQDSVDDVIEFIEGVRAAPCHLVGMSWGGMIAMRIAIGRPDLVRSLVLIDTSADAEGAESKALYGGFMRTLETEGMTEALTEASIPILFGERYRSDELAMDVYRDRVTSMKPEAIAEGLRAVIERDSVLDRLGSIEVPALVLHGAEDAGQPTSEAEKTAGAIRGAHLVVVPGAGHSVPLEAPDETNAALADFLGRVR